MDVRKIQQDFIEARAQRGAAIMDYFLHFRAWRLRPDLLNSDSPDAWTNNGNTSIG